MEKKDFEAKVGEIFTILYQGDTIELKLTQVDPLKKIEGADHIENLREEPFSLIFVGPPDKHLPDDTYTMTVQGWEDTPIFISAYKMEKEKGLFYDAVFN